MITIGHDPGRTNYAVCMIDARVIRGSVRAKILHSGFIKNTPNFKDLHASIYLYLKDVENVYMSTALPEVVVVERFQGRGIKSSLLETVNLGLGAMVSDSLSKMATTKIITPTASSWKNALNRQVDLKQWYRRIRCTPHELDSCMIALYGAHKVVGITPFYNYNDGTMLNIVSALEARTPKLRNRRCTAR